MSTLTIIDVDTDTVVAQQQIATNNKRPRRLNHLWATVDGSLTAFRIIFLEHNYPDNELRAVCKRLPRKEYIS